MESLRLWPTTPAILRETRRPVAWRGGSLPADSLVLIFTPFFHRDEETFADAHRFAPEIWEGAADHALPLAGLVPFSAGPARCPAHDLVPMIASFALGLVLSRKRLVATAPGLAPGPCPARSIIIGSACGSKTIRGPDRPKHDPFGRANAYRSFGCEGAKLAVSACRSPG